MNKIIFAKLTSFLHGEENLSGDNFLFYFLFTEQTYKILFFMESLLDNGKFTCYNSNGKFTLLCFKGCDYLKNRLEELRKQRGIKQEELADHLEVSRQTIGSLENGRYNPSIILAIKIARFFGMSVEEIFIYEEDAQ